MPIVDKALDVYGNRTWKVTTIPSVEPVTANEVKDFAHIDTDDDDALIEGFITAVRDAAEKYMHRSLIEQTITLQMDFWPEKDVIEMPSPPLISVTGVYTTDEDDNDTEYSSSNYMTITNTESYGKLVVKQDATIPINNERDYGGFKIVYKAGYGTEPWDVPQLIRQGIKLWTAIFYDTRSLMVDDEPPPEVLPFLNSYVVRKI